jgi:diadenylate cyclase
MAHFLQIMLEGWLPAVESGWRPALEILILGVGIYFAINFVRGTRGAPVVYGFVLLILTLSIVAGALQLDVLRWLLRSFVAFASMAVLIIFQPELRRILAELGTHPLFYASQEQRENIEIIVQTAERLAKSRTGALIAMEQVVGLREAVEGGVLVDCTATPEMLETIFFPNNAVHDGGVIIKSDRIAYAACIFPLTQRSDLNASLGTRHRAAIGLSEETDAVVVVVSEETGSISHVYKGQLVRGVGLEELRAFLTSVMVKPVKTHGILSWLRDFSREVAKVRDAAMKIEPPK